MTYETEVATGAAWLDANRPGWLDDVDLDTLEMDDCSRCVLGQTFPPDPRTGYGYDTGLSALHKSDGIEHRYSCDYGFSRPWGVSPGDYDDLRDAWVAYITARRTDAVMADRAFDALGPQ